MSALLRLYPKAWRERYGDEISALLEEHPASLVDQLDLIRGAFDARVHPQVPGVTTTRDKEIPVNQRLGLMAAVGGVAWILGVVSIFVLPRDAGGERMILPAMIGVAMWIGFVGIALAGLGTRHGSATSERTSLATAVVSLVLAFMAPMVWPVFFFGLFGFPIVAALLAVRGTRNGAFPGWIALVFTAAAFAVLSGVGADVDAGKDQQLILLALVGVPPLLLAAFAFRGTAAPSAAPPRLDPA